MSADVDVVIIGGGAAGIGAARRLAAAGRSALVLEATSRLGGRAWTPEVAGLALDLACGWLHSADRNPWVSIAEGSGFISGDIPERLSVADYLAYDAAATGLNWRAPAGYGSLVGASLPATVSLRLSAPAESIDLDAREVRVTTPLGPVRARAAIL